jgi:hypothetical protein
LEEIVFDDIIYRIGQNYVEIKILYGNQGTIKVKIKTKTLNVPGKLLIH